MEGVAEGVAEKETKPNKPQQYKRELDQPSNKGKSPKRRRLAINKKPRLGGSLSDPLNLEVWSDDSKCVPSSTGQDRNLGDQSLIPLPKELHHDPLNLEEKISDFTTLIENFNQIRSTINIPYKDKRKRKDNSRQKSQSELSSSMVNLTASSNAKAALYRHGNYDRYYGYRNDGVLNEDPRLKLFKKEWFVDKECLDIGCNTGQVTIEIGKLFQPKMIKGIDIDSKLIRTASKNLHRSCIPNTMPDGRTIPASILMSFGSVDWLLDKQVGGFPHNVKFLQENYVPITDGVTKPEYDVILCLSVTKWIHLNNGDVCLKRTFKKIYNNLHYDGRFVLEAQPWDSYGKKRKITSDIFENYQNISFFPEQFHDYLMSSEIGFTKHEYIGIPEKSHKGFQRPIHVYIKEKPSIEQ